MPLKMIRNDITRVSADAIVNTANPKPVFASGTDRAIYEAAGAEKLLEERKKIGDIASGEVAVTGAFALQAKYIFHTVGPIWRDGNHNEFEVLHSCYYNALHKALELKCESIAFPLIATGVYGFPKDKALQIAISEISDFLMQHEMFVYLVVFDEKSFQLSSNVMGQVQSFIDANYVAAKRETEYISSRVCSRREVKDSENYEQELCLEAQTLPEAETFNVSDSGTLDYQFANMGGTFQERLFELIDERGLSNVEVYSRANLDRKHFSKIQCNANYHPSKKTAMALCIALRLNLDESRDLMARAEWAFSPNRKLDLIVMNAIVSNEYNINVINAVLFEYGQECLGV